MANKGRGPKSLEDSMGRVNTAVTPDDRAHAAPASERAERGRLAGSGGGFIARLLLLKGKSFRETPGQAVKAP